MVGNFEGDYIWIYKAAVVLWIIFGLGYLAMILNYISRAMRSKKVCLKNSPGIFLNCEKKLFIT